MRYCMNWLSSNIDTIVEYDGVHDVATFGD